MEQKKDKKVALSQNRLAMWGIPLVILLVLIILLIIELTGSDKSTSENERSSVVTLVQPDDEIIDEEIEKQDIEAFPVKEQVKEPKVTVEKVQSLDVPLSRKDRLEADDSYIVEEGDSLWKIAEKKSGDPWKWKTILIQNKDQVNYTIVSAETGEWKVIIDTGKRLTMKFKEKGSKGISFGRTRKKRYAVQLMSLNLDQLEQAVDIVKFLIRDGYYTYLYRTHEKIKGQFYYRIRVGFFKTEADALARGEEIYKRYRRRKIFTTDYWAVLPSYGELGGELIDFGIQRSKPWIIQLGQLSSRRSAINTLKPITGIADFSYISQKRVKGGGFVYRTRVGFFETRKQARKNLGKIRNSGYGRFAGAKIMKVRHILEAAPGQKTGVSKISKIRR